MFRVTLLAVASTGVMFGFSGCSSDGDVDDTADSAVVGNCDSAVGHCYAVVSTVAGDYSTGSFAQVSLDDWRIEDVLFQTSTDPVVTAEDNMVFQINRLGADNVRRYEPGVWEAPIWEMSLGDAANPHDVEVCGGDLYATLYSHDYLGVYDVQSGTLKGSVDLSAFADTDGLSPEASQLVEIDGMLYVGLQRLDTTAGWKSEGSVVVEVDCAEMAVSRSWSVGGNINLSAWPGSGKLLAGVEAYGEDVAGIYVIDPQADAVSLLVESVESTVTGIATDGEKAIAVTSADDGSNYSLHCVDLTMGEMTLLEETQSYLNSISANDRGEAWLTAGSSWMDPSAPTGVFVYDIAACVGLSELPLRFSMLPTRVAFY